MTYKTWPGLNLDYDNSFDPTPKLKSSPIPIKFISFNENDNNCFYCKNPYTETLLFKQKYCETCLLQYINYVDNNHKYLDVLLTNSAVSCLCIECIRCFKITCFKQVVATNPNRDVKLVAEKNCKLCGKLIYQDSKFIEMKFCSDCYKISSELIESTLAELSIQILYLPWWDTHSRCIVCLKNLTFIFDCQKWCSYCNIIYTGCRHCLITNIIFGFTRKSQCRKCSRIMFITIDITNIISGANDLDNELIINLNINSLSLYRCHLYDPFSPLKWISYSNIKIVKEIAQGDFGIIYLATYKDLKITVAVKKFLGSKSITKSFLSELKSYYQLCKDYRFIIKCHGIVKDPITNEYILKVIHKINFIHRDLHSGNILFFRNINTIYDFRYLITLHKFLNEFYKRLVEKIGDFGLSQSENDPSKNDEIYGVIPYIAPEIFYGANFSKASDIYSFGMIMWELTTGCKPFDNVEHDISLIFKIIDGKRPEITNDTPECFANLMKRCWDPDPSKRPYISDISDTISKFLPENTNDTFEWNPESTNDKFELNLENINDTFEWTRYLNPNPSRRLHILKVSDIDFSEQFHQAEENRLKLIKSKKLGPKFTEKPHSKAIYISRPLKISKSLSINKLSININPEYTSKEYDIDINDIQSSSSHGKNFAIQNSSNTQHPGTLRSLIIKSKKLDEKLNNEEYISKEYEYDINDVQSPTSSNVIFVRQSSSRLAIRKRNIEELNIIPQSNGKRIKQMKIPKMRNENQFF
ncbi:kinase-like domain-containing protein [Rhizophagus diaphanus]|nr:kinase-like domain-containing protein [Rhizophagus diaphanus] [Rhizophagus sp. MUCL 43196]